jgi:exosortase E/protease (VPEID-CTERM system)
MPGSTPHGPAGQRLRLISSHARPAILLALLACEGLGLGLRFDAQALADGPSSGLAILARVLGGASAFAITLVAASLLLGSKRWLEELAMLRSAKPPAGFALRLIAQVCSFGALYAASVQLFDFAWSAGWWEAGAWALALAATLGFWLALWAHWPVLLRLTRRMAPLVAGSVVLAAVAYAGGRFCQRLWEPLRTATFSLAASMAKVLVPAVEIDPSQCVIGVGDFAVEIAPQCSGYEGLGLTLVFVGAFLWFFRDRLRFPRCILLLVVAPLIVWLLNVMRIAGLVAIGVHVSASLALGTFHSYVGSLLFAGANLAIAFAVLRAPMFLREGTTDKSAGSSPSAGESLENYAATHLIPFLCLVAVGLVTATISPEGATTWYPVKILAAGGAIYCCRASVRRFLRPEAAMSDEPGNPPPAARLWRVIWVASLSALAWLLSSAFKGTPAAARDIIPTFAASVSGQLSTATWWSLRIAGTVLVVPLAEELAFRGYVIRRLISPDVEVVKWTNVSTVALVVQAILFGILHPQHMLGASIAGLAYGWLGRSTRSGYAPVLAHALTNAIVVAMAAVMQRWDWL